MLWDVAVVNNHEPDYADPDGLSDICPAYKSLHVEVYDVKSWYKINVGIGGAFFVNSLCKSAMVTL